MVCANFIFPLAEIALRLDRFSPWTALGLFILTGGFTVLLGMRSLAGLGKARQRAAIAVRLLVLALLILILGDIKWVRKNTDVEVMVVRDISRSTGLVPVPRGQYLQSMVDDYLLSVTKPGSDAPSRREGDKVGEISFNERSFIDAIPGPTLSLEARAVRDAGTGTDAAAALQLGLASMGNDTLHRILLIWDGNATAGDLQSALAAASSQHVPIDVMPLHYNVEHEVMMDQFIAPTWEQEGQAFNLDVILENRNNFPVQGDLSVTNNGRLMELSGGKTTRRIALQPGKNVEHIQVPAQSANVHQFHAVVSNLTRLDADSSGQDTPVASQLDNKSADVFTFVKGKGQVLLVENADPDTQADEGVELQQALADQQINVVTVTPDQFPNNPVELQAYEAVVLANVPRGVGGLSDDQDRMLASYVHDTGGGLVMIGGAQTFGAGGWEGSKLEQELPVKMEVPAQREIPKGALVLCMDPSEAPDGNYWGEQCAIKAMEALSSSDDIGVISYAFSNGGGCRWDAPLAAKGTGSAVVAAIKNWELGDLPDFDQAVNLALDGDGASPGLLKSDARAKHIIIITDDDPQLPTPATIDKCIKGKVSISTVTIYPHLPGNVAPGIRELAKATGGKSYGPIEGNMSQVPQIFIKEASIVKRSIIQESRDGYAARLVPSASELVKGIAPGLLPPLYGYDLTSRKDNPLIDVPMTIGPKHDPLLASWQAGLGKSAVFTSGRFRHWANTWAGASFFDKFWAQVVRGVSRSPVSSDFEMEMTTDGNQGHITVRAEKQGDAFNNFLDIAGTVAGGPDLSPRSIHLLQTGPGTYEADFDASAQGNYICYLTYMGQNGKRGTLLAGTSVNSSPELRDLQSNDALLEQIAQRTGGRVLPPFDPSAADLFSRDGLLVTGSPQSIWDWLVPVLLGMIILDVAVRRIAWDWAATKRLAAAAAARVRQFTTTYRRIEDPTMLQNLKQVRAQTSEQRFKPAEAASPAPPAVATQKFDVGDQAVEGNIADVVGGAVDKPAPRGSSAVPKGAVGLGEYTGGLLEAKRRARQKIEQQQEK